MSYLFVICSFLSFCVFFFFKQKTAYEMRISDWSSDVCSSDLSSQTDYSRNLPQRHTRPYATLSFLSQESIFRTERTDMASTAPASPRSARTGRSIASVDTLRRKALEKLTLAITKAVEAASDDTLADIVGSEDLRHALAIAPRDIAPEAPADLEAIKKARERTARFREDMATRAGGMYDRDHVAAMLGVTPAAIEKQRQRRRSEEHTSELQSLMR